LFSDGGLFSWGLGTTGQLGDNTAVTKSSPVQTVSAGNNWKQVSCGTTYTAAIKTDGTLWAWGAGGNGRLGSGSITNRSSPVQTSSGGTNWKQVSCGAGPFTGSIKTDGTLWMWGLNTDGQLGNNTVTGVSSPIQTISSGADWKQVSVGSAHTAAVKTNGTLWLWGLGTSGQLGNNAATSRSSPVQTVSGGTNWRQVATSTNSTACIKTDGTLWTWGINGGGQLGDNSIASKSSPVQTVSGGTNWKQVSAKGSHAAAIKTDGTLWLWGGNSFGALGTNNTTSRSSPVQTVSGGTNWKQVECGDDSTACIKTDGTLWLWGLGSNGRIGDNAATSRSSPVQTVAAGTNWKQVSAFSHSAAVKDDNY
jgi:alpha-tubulin suppressor-like RCC1 family protein